MGRPLCLSPMTLCYGQERAFITYSCGESSVFRIGPNPQFDSVSCRPLEDLVCIGKPCVSDSSTLTDRRPRFKATAWIPRPSTFPTLAVPSWTRAIVATCATRSIGTSRSPSNVRDRTVDWIETGTFSLSIGKCIAFQTRTFLGGVPEVEGRWRSVDAKATKTRTCCTQERSALPWAYCWRSIP